jgi:S-formylglutathione hydrolase FrmB
MRRTHFLILLLTLLFVSDGVGQRRFGRGRDRDVIPQGSRVQYKTFRSDILGRQLDYALYLPPSYDQEDHKYPVIFFLHGANENEKRWSTRGQTDLMLDQLIEAGEIGEFIVAVPFGSNSFYTNSIKGDRWEDMITDEFIPMIESTTRAEGTRSGRAISGISMGGYGALKLAFKHPDLFSSVSAHSAMLIDDFAAVAISLRRAQMFYSLFDQIFGVSEDLAYWDENNPLRIARESDLNGLRIYFDCGTEDEYGFYLGARQLSDVLKGKGIAHEFHLYPGTHGWDYARQHTADSLKFHWEGLRSN